jgi:N-acetylmuramoyl-L-alanine amidase
MMLTTAAICLAINIYHEARSQPVMGQYAVALVTMNRAGGDPKKVCKVVLAPKQFSWTTNLVHGTKLLAQGLPVDQDAWKKAWIIANVTLQGRMNGFNDGSTFYHAKRVHPYWTAVMAKTRSIGEHVFYRQHGYVIADLQGGKQQ